MSTSEPNLPRAWEPLTPRGVAAFAGASWKRLLVVQLIMALLAAGTVVWFVEKAWLPVVRMAVRQLPAEGEIVDGQLAWSGESPVRLARNPFLGLSVDLTHSGQVGREAQIQVEFGRKDYRVISMLGYHVLEYPKGWRMAFNQKELEPRWGAWEPMLIASTAAGTLVALLVSWLLLATLYCGPLWLLAFFQNRELSLGQSWRLAGAALMPGALFLTIGMICYGLGMMDLIRLGGIWAIHMVMGWVYLLISPCFLPRHPATVAVKGNPFAST